MEEACLQFASPNNGVLLNSKLLAAWRDASRVTRGPSLALVADLQNIGSSDLA